MSDTELSKYNFLELQQAVNDLNQVLDMPGLDFLHEEAQTALDRVNAHQVEVANS